MKARDEILDQVRTRARFACEYCGVYETDAGGLLTVDHYQPISRGGNENVENLVYACIRCNQYKRDYWPASPADPLLWNPRQERADVHMVELEDGRLEALTAKGAFSVRLLHLNRPALVAYRQKRRQAAAETEWLERYRQLAAVLEQLVAQQAQLIGQQQALLAEQRELLRRLLGRLR